LDGSAGDEIGVEVWRGGVNTWECDVQAHLNARFYVRKSLEALAGLAAELGLPGAFSPAAENTLAIRDIYVRYLRETPTNTPLSIVGGVLERGPCDARLLLVMRHPGGEPAAAFQFVVDHASAQDRRPRPWPAAFSARARALKVEPPRYATPRTLDLSPVATSSASLERAQALGLMRLALSVVSPAECDVFGWMRPDVFLGRIGDGMPRMVARKPGPAGEARRMGGAAVEYRLIYFTPPRAGDRIEVRSAVVEATSHYRRMGHWLLDPETGQPWGVAANVGVNFDLQTRRLATLTPEEVAANQAYVTPEMSL
jgi:acyl-CoA thioester hydrolase